MNFTSTLQEHLPLVVDLQLNCVKTASFNITSYFTAPRRHKQYVIICCASEAEGEAERGRRRWIAEGGRQAV